MRSILSLILFSSYTRALYPNPYGNPTGNISLYTDSSCHTNAYANGWTIGGDFCVVFTPETSYGSPPNLGSYLINLRPTCDNGSYADWATYEDTTCVKEKSRVPNNNDDECVSSEGVMAVAFICEGFGGSGPTTTSSMVSGATTSSSSFTVTKSKDEPKGTPTTPFSTSSAAVMATNSVSRSVTAQNGASSSATLSAPSAVRTGAASHP